MLIALTGDVMLGRLVDAYVVRDENSAPAGLWGDVLPLLLEADLRLANLECVISSCGEKWRPAAKRFHFRAHPRAVEFLKAAGVDCVTLANNHTLDYGTEGLLECLDLLDRAGIRHAGAGRDLDAALEPALLETPEGRVAVVALTDNEPVWEAGRDRPGTNFVAWDDDGLVEPYRSRLREAIELARSRADLVVAGAHVGPNWGSPSSGMRALAHQLVDFGVDIYWGHSNHTPQGIEIYNATPIIYSAGDFIDDYAIDPEGRNDLSFLFVAEVMEGHVRRIDLHPIAIERFHVRQARDEEVAFLQERMRSLSSELGTELQSHGEALSAEYRVPSTEC
jgi:poly-gamma-glutamate capsule biosynthesis protein CapA/YwtB (metallophosphatase superfamily)